MIDTGVAGVVRLLASFTATGSRQEMSQARAGIKELAHQQIDIAGPLFDVAIYLLRNDMEDDDE